MSDKVLIYGGSGGVGSATARRPRAKGYELHLAGCDENKLKAISLEIEAGYSTANVEDAAPSARVSAEAGWITGQIIGVDGGRSRLRVKG
jgi:NADP-dependent 3-hydroxy acid dehydrogenase YdfG